MNKKKLNESIRKSAKGLWQAFPILLGTILLISLLTVLVPKEFYSKIFIGNFFLDPLIGALIGSISAGNPVTSYILAGEMIKQGINLLSITAFIVAWVTVGVIQFPAESMILGKKFALLRNLTAFILSIIVAILTILLLRVI